MKELVFLLLVLACPLAMFLMMRGGHGHGGHGHVPGERDDQRLSADELRRRRGELNRLIEERERAGAVARETTRLHQTDDRERRAGASDAR